MRKAKGKAKAATAVKASGSRAGSRSGSRSGSKAKARTRPPLPGPRPRKRGRGGTAPSKSASRSAAPRPARDPVARGDLMADSVAATSVLDLVKYDDRGLVPVVAQEEDGTVLMLAWANRAALEETLATGRGTYWSRSRQELWRKGDTSGHRQEVSRIAVDCDGDSVLYTLRQTGPACHTGARTCFFTAQDL